MSICSDADIEQYKEMIAKNENVIIGPKSFRDLLARLAAVEAICNFAWDKKLINQFGELAKA